jgi:trehalose-phosphatase
MRRVVVYPGRIAVEAAEVPVPGPAEALVRTLAVGVCGSDLHAAHGTHPFVSLPYRPGHEVVGVIEAAGSAAAAVSPGQRVIVEPDLPCWTCKMCTSGRENLCENLQFFGCGYAQGGMADYFTLAANRLHPVPEEFDDHTAAIIEPLSTPVHAVRLAGDIAGRSVAVLGAGAIGLFTLAVLRAHGAGKVVSTDPNLAKRERAQALGADATIDARTPDVAGQVREVLGGSADIVFDCVAVQSSMDQAIAIADKGGTVMVVGVPARDVTVPLPIVQDHQIRIQGSATYLPQDYSESAGLHRRRAVITDPLRAALPAGLVALDFDGTLAPISPRPGDARPLAGVEEILRSLRATGATLAVVTGRSVASLLRVSGFGAIPGIVIYGTHGAERWQAGELRTAAAPPGLDELRLSLPGLLAGAGPDLWLEDKGLSLVIHARLTPEPERVLELLRAPVEAAAAAVGLGVRPGKEVLELCIPGIDKGTALGELVSDDPAAAFYAGDDLGDLPAMRAVHAWARRSGRPALTVGVGSGPVAGQADVTVPDPQGLLSLLRQLLRPN